MIIWLTRREPIAISDVEAFAKTSQSWVSKNLLKSGMKSYLAYPLIFDGKLLAMIELGSPRKYELTSATIHQLENVIPMVAMAANQFAEEKKIRVEAIIQEECTTIHPSVKWRFEEEAYEYLAATENGEEAQFSDIVFPDIFPLYGQLDIRGSSTLRNTAVQADLAKHLKGVMSVLKSAQKKVGMPIYEQLGHRVNGYLQEVKAGLLAGSEHRIQLFLQAEVYPVFAHLKKTNPEIGKAITKFEALLDPELQVVYEKRKEFDESVMTTNRTLAAFLDEKQDAAQAMYPHYFERYKTDGVEFNMYVGESITREDSFDPIYLSNLRLWQLMVMCEMENEFHQLRKSLSSPLEVASLILVNNSPLSIHFRLDEKRFDVEGAYNARYEIIKKARRQGTYQRHQ